MIPQDNGEVLEFGTMVNPGTGKEERYEECWVDLEAEVVAGEEAKRSWVLRCEDPETGTRGMVVRVGTWMQGVVRRGQGIGVGRWRWKGKWERAVGIGEVDVPALCFGVQGVMEGQSIVGGDGLVWECVEAFDWS